MPVHPRVRRRISHVDSWQVALAALSGARRTAKKQKHRRRAGLVVIKRGSEGRMREYERHADEEEHERQPGCGEGAGLAVCCCCPLALLDVLLLVTVKLPAGVMRRVRKQRRRRHRDGTSRRKKRSAAAAEPASSPSGSSGKAMMIGAASSPLETEEEDAAAGVSELEREIMSSWFYGAGFWRSISSGSSSSASIRHQ